MLRFLALLLFAGYGLTACADEVSICYNYSCAVRATVIFSGKQLLKLKALLQHSQSAEAERMAIAQAVGLMETFAGEQTPTHNDKGGNANDDEIDGRMDCIDHAHNTTAYLKLLEARGWLKFHRVLDAVKRAPFLVNDHWGARIQETQSGQEYIVDSWFFDNGHPAAIFELDDWMHGASPHES